MRMKLILDHESMRPQLLIQVFFSRILSPDKRYIVYDLEDLLV